jgi:predicted alpha/beta-fold hydrolase
LVLHEDRPDDEDQEGTCCLLVHGLAGCHGSPYMVRTAHKLNARGIRTFRLDLRGYGAGFHMAQKPGHAGRSEDVRAAVRFLAERCPDSALVLVGFSLGANLVLKLLGEWSDNVPPCVARAMAVAPPIDLHACARNIERARHTLYNRWFVRALMRDVARRREFVPSLRELDLARPPRKLREFDDRITAPLSGFAGAREYYTRSSSRRVLHRIRVPTLILAARDDPIVPCGAFDSLPHSPHLTVHITRHGGHLGFFARKGTDADRRWMDWRVVDFVTASDGAVLND